MSEEQDKPEAIDNFSDAGDAAFAKLNEKPEESPKEPEAPKPPETPANDSGEADKLSWLKSLDEKTLSDLREGKHIPKHRFDELAQKIKSYESFGSPEELAARLKAPPAPPPKPEADPNAALTDEDKAFQSYVLKMFPFMKDLPKTQEEFNRLQGEFNKARENEQTARVADRTALIKSGESKIKSLCEVEGLPIDDKNLALHIGNITDILHDPDNKALADKFYNERNVDVLKTVFDDYFKRFFSGFQRKAKVDLLKSSDNQKQLPKPPIKGGSPEVEIKKPLTKEQALEEIGKRWKASEAA